MTRVAAPSRLLAVAADPLGRVVYLGQERPELWALDAVTGRRLWSRPLDAMAINVSVSPDGRRLAVLVVDRTGVVSDHVVVLDREGEEQWRLTIDDVRRRTGVPSPICGARRGGVRTGRSCWPPTPTWWWPTRTGPSSAPSRGAGRSWTPTPSSSGATAG